MNSKEYYKKNRVKIIKNVLLWQRRNKKRVNERNKRWKEHHKESVHNTYINYKNKYKKEIFKRYGNKCSFCGSKRKLCLDHINNDGDKHREKYKAQIWIWAVKNGFPKSLQLLCYKCNERKKHAFKEGISLKEWSDRFDSIVLKIKKLKKEGLSFARIAKILDISTSNCSNIFYRYRGKREEYNERKTFKIEN